MKSMVINTRHTGFVVDDLEGLLISILDWLKLISHANRIR